MDAESVVSTVLGEQSTSHYTVTLACTAGDCVFSYEFATPGPADTSRARRGMCYYDHVLFRAVVPGIREQLLAERIVFDVTRTSGVMHPAMMSAYQTVMRAVDGTDVQMQIMRVEQRDAVPAAPLLVTESPALGALPMTPVPLVFDDLVCCQACGRVDDADTAVCRQCGKSPRGQEKK
jgi:hypothetical protein